MIAEKLKSKIEADYWFERGLELEQTGAPHERVIEAYQKAANLDPQSAAAVVNLGTVFFMGMPGRTPKNSTRRRLKSIRITRSPISI